MTDLRQGVSEAGHKVLDAVDRLKDGPMPISIWYHISEAERHCVATRRRPIRRDEAIAHAAEAAARLVLFIEQELAQ